MVRVAGSEDDPIIFFDDAAEFRQWLATHHDTATELWMGLNKKHVRPLGLTWADAVRVALCYGWIDSQSRRIDEDAVRQRWTPRRPGSIWSEINVKAVGELTAAGLMHPAGLAAFAKRREDRTGVYSFEQGEQTLPPAYLAALEGNSAASTFWDGATAGYRKIAVHWVLSAKQQATRDRRMAELVDDCAQGRLIKTQRYGVEPTWVARMRAQLGLAD